MQRKYIVWGQEKSLHDYHVTWYRGIAHTRRYDMAEQDRGIVKKPR
jgi:hypothetical protein